jgi:hypothetical protein
LEKKKAKARIEREILAQISELESSKNELRPDGPKLYHRSRGRGREEQSTRATVHQDAKNE